MYTYTKNGYRLGGWVYPIHCQCASGVGCGLVQALVPLAASSFGTCVAAWFGTFVASWLATCVASSDRILSSVFFCILSQPAWQYTCRHGTFSM